MNRLINMSITITIAKNKEYCKEHNLGKRNDDECICVRDNVSMEACCYCGGSGVMTSIELPFTLNMASVNFVMLWRLLGLEPFESGEIRPQTILAKFLKTSADNHWFKGQSDTLKSICMEAWKREELVEWG